MLIVCVLAFLFNSSHAYVSHTAFIFWLFFIIILLCIFIILNVCYSLFTLLLNVFNVCEDSSCIFALPLLIMYFCKAPRGLFKGISALYKRLFINIIIIIISHFTNICGDIHLY